MPTIRTLALSLYKYLPGAVSKDFTARTDIHSKFFFFKSKLHNNHRFLLQQLFEDTQISCDETEASPMTRDKCTNGKVHIKYLQ